MLPKHFWDLNHFLATPEYNQWGPATYVRDMDEFNGYLKVAKDIFGDKPTLHYTKKGHIEQNKGYWGWGIRKLRSYNTLELNLVWEGFMWRFVFMPGREEDGELSGVHALITFRKYVKGTEFDKQYACYTNEEVEEVKRTIPSALIAVSPAVAKNLKLRIAYEHVDHFDLNSAYAAQVARTFPEIAPFFYDLYTHRKQNPENKKILCQVIGANQSTKLYGVRYPILAKVAYQGTIDALMELSLKLELAGYEILSYNTDGIWARRPTPDFIYHDENEGNMLGQWKRDHSDVLIRYKSKGCYEWMEDGEYHHAARGIKDIYLNEWGDIFKHDSKTYAFDKDKMEVIEINDEENDAY